MNVNNTLLDPHSNTYRPGFAESFRSLFYVLLPSESSFSDVSKVPNYIDAALHPFIALILLELVVGLWKGKRVMRINDGISSLSAGTLSQLIKLVSAKSIEVSMYVFVYDKYSIADLPWDCAWLWIVTFLGVDLCYYWFHRGSHEINIFWASHQTHHSSEDYNLTTALRQSAIAGPIVMLFYLPLALFVPPPVYLVHKQFNLLFQFWIHTEIIDNLGPLEYILNTPSHHRVHHGRNAYCIDKNYAGTLIIWDRMFGTFVKEKSDEEIAYGHVHPINTFDPIFVQTGNLRQLVTRCWQTKGLWNKLCVVVKGPGWDVGKPWCGNLQDIPAIENPIKRYNHYLPYWLSTYAVVHYITLVPMYESMMKARLMLPGYIIIIDVAYFLFSLSCLGFLFDNKAYARHIEFLRCVGCALLLHMFRDNLQLSHHLPSTLFTALIAIYAGSVVIWVVVLMSGSKKKVN
ncbi:alkylglycerol monooxygenase-like isoform X1 [Ciona intestinalis]